VSGVSQDYQRFIEDEAQLLDERKFGDWLQLYDEDSFVWAPAVFGAELHTRLETVSVVHDDWDLLNRRVERLGHPGIHSQMPPARSSRTVSNFRMIDVPAELGVAADVGLQSRFLMVEARLDEQRIWAGTYEHYLRLRDNEMRIGAKVVRFLNCDTALSNVGLPF
jgi:3-phenylpropionate/cinnamic acid dioxygenase small subunit